MAYTARHPLHARCCMLHAACCLVCVVCYALRVACCMWCTTLAHGDARQREMRRSGSFAAGLWVRAVKASRLLAHRYRRLYHIAQHSRRCKGNVPMGTPSGSHASHAHSRPGAQVTGQYYPACHWTMFCLKPIRRPRQHSLRRHALGRARRVCPTPQNIVGSTHICANIRKCCAGTILAALVAFFCVFLADVSDGTACSAELAEYQARISQLELVIASTCAQLSATAPSRSSEPSPHAGAPLACGTDGRRCTQPPVLPARFVGF
jgi:hypothetical protein